MQVIFWLSVFIVFYTYAGYALLLILLPKRKKIKKTLVEHPAITVVVPVYNEEKFIRQKISNCLSLAYEGEIHFLFINDGSSDRTAEIIGAHKGIHLINIPKRTGKTAVLNKAMATVTTPFAVFTDANAMLDKDCLSRIVQHYADEKVGGVSGEKKISQSGDGSVVDGAEQLYWKYESFLKKIDSDFYSVVGADGGLYSIRSHLFRPVRETVILDDFFISVQVCEQGYLFVYEPAAFAVETSSVSIDEEQKRKIRISAGCFQALVLLKRLLNPFKHLPLFFIYTSHRVLRWVACPLLLPLIFFSNLLLILTETTFIYRLSFLFQLLFYLSALAAWLVPELKKIRTFLLPYYFVFMNFSLYLGFSRYLQKKQPVLWEKTERNSF